MKGEMSDALVNLIWASSMLAKTKASCVSQTSILGPVGSLGLCRTVARPLEFLLRARLTVAPVSRALLMLLSCLSSVAFWVPLSLALAAAKESKWSFRKTSA